MTGGRLTGLVYGLYKSSLMQKLSFRSAKLSPTKLVRWQLVGGLTFVIAIVALALTVSSQQWHDLLQILLDDRGWTASLTLIGLYILAVILMVPLSPFAVTAGVFFGFWQGSVIALLAINIGALISFLIARHWLSGNCLRISFKPRYMRLLTSNNIKIISLLRINPLLPFSVHNYLYGAAKTRVRPYLWGTFLGSAPFTLVLVYFGVTGRAIYRTGSSLGPWQYAMLGLGIVLLLVLLGLTKYAKSANHFSE